MEKSRKSLINKKIILAEDDAEFRSLMIWYLHNEGFDFDVCSDGASVVNLLSKNRYSLLITDLAMPEVSGIEVIKKLRQTDRRLPVIVITVMPDENTVNELKVLNVTKILSKPFDLTYFITLIKEVMRQ